MAGFDISVRDYMTRSVLSVGADDDLSTAQRRLIELGVSALAVVDHDETLIGVVSRSDLLRLGKLGDTERGQRLLELPQVPVADAMQRMLTTVSPEETVAQAAARMVEGHVHRVFVIATDELGILTTRDVMRAIADSRLEAPVSEHMRAPVTANADEPAHDAAERLERENISSLVVVDEGWPIGVFGEAEALEAREQGSAATVEQVMTAALVSVDPNTPVHRAAAQAAAMEVRLVVVAEHLALKGVLGGLDFAAIAAGTVTG